MKCLRQWITVMAIGAMAGGLSAQQPVRPVSEDATVRIVRLPQMNAFKARTPSFTGGAASTREWGVFDVEFDSAKEWTDMNVNFMLFMNNAKDADKPFSLFKTSVRYPDVEKGKRKKVGVVLSPEALKRFGSPIGFAVEFMVDGKPAAVQSIEGGVLQGKDKWWDDPQIVNSPKTVKRDGYLLDRGKTPFGYVSIDDYEMSRQ